MNDLAVTPGSVAQIGRRPILRFPRTDLSRDLSDRDAERCVAVEHGDTDLELRDLTVEVPCHEALPQQLHTMHLRLDAAPAVVSAPSPPEGASQIFRGAQGLVSGHGSGGDGLPRFAVATCGSLART